ncbi:MULTISPECIES: glycosyltransferase family 2 protein [Bacteroides]|uniref:Glycosyltransferase n=1 Tax=Bacteroides fragilis TaxID=817 RepID=A0ABD4VS24_BACFG|nr:MULTISPECIES: glycosyltransferase [Bacteroides]MCE8566693.1 glycosyltransferase [Bacteroides fragilis]MCM0195718.1 glycosyltransferase [Bacteroides fragilis]MCM0199496.1 glycosyltransferase [Bacteroides fragilis]MCM0210896.1 glycosyltransferase [Bacteroides fragilis]MCM0214355.1 glycosyltransferase [Bacteroides fragilis]
MEYAPLVSVCVIAYNSSKYIWETLESIRMQSYIDIELIISDDASHDDTVDICEKWLNLHEKRFIRTELVVSSVNTGVSANCNRAYRKAKGDWIKGIAADDVLLPDCILVNICHILKNKNILILFSKVDLLISSDSNMNKISDLFNFSFFSLSAEEQKRYLLINGNCVPAASVIMSRDLFLAHEFDERLPLLEDYPYWLYLTKRGIKLEFIDVVTVLYRIHNQSISTSSTKSILCKKTENKFFFLYLLPGMFTVAPLKTVIKIFHILKEKIQKIFLH